MRVGKLLSAITYPFRLLFHVLTWPLRRGRPLPEEPWGAPEGNEPIPPSVLAVLEQVGREFAGQAAKPLLGAPRLVGHIDGREFVARWRRRGRIELSCRARSDLDLDARAPTWPQRLIGHTDPYLHGNSALDLRDTVASLFQRYDGIRMEVRGGHLRCLARPGLDALSIANLTRELLTLAWTEPDGKVVVRPATERAARPRPASAQVAGLRCPFCHDDLQADQPVVHCATCDAPHHPSCFEEGAGCSIAGCHQARARGHKAPV